MDYPLNDQPVTIERTLNAPAARVWKAITDSEQMKQWYFDIADFQPEVGFEFHFLAGPAQKQYLHVCKVTEVESGKKLTYSWRYDGYEGMSYVTFELVEEGKHTRLRLTHRGLETLPRNNPDFARDNFAEGWTYIIDTALKGFVEKDL